MENFSKETIGYRKVVGSPNLLRNAEFDRCYFDGGALVQYDDPTCGLVVKNVILRRCRAGNSVLHGVRFEDVTIDGLACRSLLQLESCLFERVTLGGRIGPMITMPVSNTIPEPTQAAFREQAMEFFTGIEWALDISGAAFSDADFSQIPGNLVRRDPETQFLVHKEAALSVTPDSLPGLAAIVTERARKSPYDTTVAVVPTRSKNAARYREELEVLRAGGIAE